MRLALPNLHRTKDYETISLSRYLSVNLFHAAVITTMSLAVIFIVNLIDSFVGGHLVSYTSPVALANVLWVFFGYISTTTYVWFRARPVSSRAKVEELEHIAMTTRWSPMAGLLIGFFVFYTLAIIFGMLPGLSTLHPSLEIAAGIALFAFGAELGTIYNRSVVV